MTDKTQSEVPVVDASGASTSNSQSQIHVGIYAGGKFNSSGEWEVTEKCNYPKVAKDFARYREIGRTFAKTVFAEAEKQEGSSFAGSKDTKACIDQEHYNSNLETLCWVIKAGNPEFDCVSYSVFPNRQDWTTFVKKTAPPGADDTVLGTDHTVLADQMSGLAIVPKDKSVEDDKTWV